MLTGVTVPADLTRRGWERTQRDGNRGSPRADELGAVEGIYAHPLQRYVVRRSGNGVGEVAGESIQPMAPSRQEKRYMSVGCHR